MMVLLLLWTILASMATLAFGRRDHHVAAGLDKLLTDHSSLKTEHISQLWQTFKSSFKKVYDRADEELERFAHFERNARLIHGHNADPSRNFKLGFNSYSDMSPHQMRLSLNGLRYSKKTRYDSRLKFRRSSFVADLNNGKTSLDESIDYRSKGVVTPVKDQGNCGSCYSFSATGALEGAFALAGHGLRNLSEQQILDCSGAWGNNGCNGGLMDFCFQYVIDNRGIDSEESYPYETIDDLCRFNRSNVAASCVGFVDILPEGNEEALLQALKQHGPISIGIDASPTSFMFYRSGVYSDRDCSSESLDHGVLLVGAGVEKSVDKNGSEVLEPYWLVKNSWGTSWGDHGYIKLARNMNNMCGVATAASYPIVKK